MHVLQLGTARILLLSVAALALGFPLGLGAALLSSSPPSAAATPTTLYVNSSGTGTTTGCVVAAPCPSIADAIAVAEGASLAGDSVTIAVAAGAYDESDTIDDVTSATVTNPVVSRQILREP